MWNFLLYTKDWEDDENRERALQCSTDKYMLIINALQEIFLLKYEIIINHIKVWNNNGKNLVVILNMFYFLDEVSWIG